MLAGKTVFVSGGSRGIGKAIALRCARDGANVVIASKTVDPHPKLPGTIHTTVQEGQLMYIHVCAFAHLCFYCTRPVLLKYFWPADDP